MKPIPLIIYAFILVILSQCKTPEVEYEKEHSSKLISRIGFGSCGYHDKAQPVLGLAAMKRLDAFVFLGDNIYGDTKEMDTLKAKYGRFKSKIDFQKIWNSTQVLATWDDHDYGWNDIGRHYAYKEASKEIFLDFWNVPQTDIRRTREGIYTSYFYENNEKTVQIILLDTRTFRDDLKRYDGSPIDTVAYHYHIDYSPYQTSDSTLLGQKQWQWLETQLKIPADIRIIASSTQFGISWNGYETWANFPHERQRFANLVKQTKANGVLFISGDVHYAEVSKFETPDLYPIYDVTSSGITSTWHFATPNENRIEGPIMENHFGMIEIDWEAEDPNISMKVIDVSDSLRFQHDIKLSEISF